MSALTLPELVASLDQNAKLQTSALLLFASQETATFLLVTVTTTTLALLTLVIWPLDSVFIQIKSALPLME